MKYTFIDILEVLSESTTNELFNVNPMLFTEKATREQYRLNAFKKKYKYDPKEKTIIVDGEKYKVDLDIKRKYITITDGVTKIKQACADINASDPIIYLDRDFFKLKNAKEE